MWKERRKINAGMLKLSAENLLSMTLYFQIPFHFHLPWLPAHHLPSVAIAALNFLAFSQLDPMFNIYVFIHVASSDPNPQGPLLLISNPAVYGRQSVFRLTLSPHVCSISHFFAATAQRSSTHHDYISILFLCHGCISSVTVSSV
jgi:hypothetical protein